MLCAVGVGGAFGFAQGLVITSLDLGSVSITLGGLLTASGLSYVITHNQVISSDNLDLATMVNDPVAGLFSIHSLVVMAIFVGAAVIFAATRLGRDLIAVGSDRKAAMITGVSVKKLMLGAFTFSGLMAALSGSMLSYGLASASPSGLSDDAGSIGRSRHTRWRVLVRWDGHAFRHRRRCLDVDPVALGA